jgi:hypothetical protein
MNATAFLPFGFALLAGLGTWVITGSVVAFLLLARKWIMDLLNGGSGGR